MILEFMTRSVWLIVYDEQNRSAKKRKKDKLGILEETTEEDVMVLLRQRLEADYPEMFQEEDSEEEEGYWNNMEHYTTVIER